jgi:hypothetical protein
VITESTVHNRCSIIEVDRTGIRREPKNIRPEMELQIQPPHFKDKETHNQSRDLHCQNSDA